MVRRTFPYADTNGENLPPVRGVLPARAPSRKGPPGRRPVVIGRAAIPAAVPRAASLSARPRPFLHRVVSHSAFNVWSGAFILLNTALPARRARPAEPDELICKNLSKSL